MDFLYNVSEKAVVAILVAGAGSGMRLAYLRLRGRKEPADGGRIGSPSAPDPAAAVVREEDAPDKERGLTWQDVFWGLVTAGIVVLLLGAAWWFFSICAGMAVSLVRSGVNRIRGAWRGDAR